MFHTLHMFHKKREILRITNFPYGVEILEVQRLVNFVDNLNCFSDS